MAVINPWTWGLGRRKTAIARVRLKPGAGGFVVNGKPMDNYFVTTQSRQRAGQAWSPRARPRCTTCSAT